MRDLITGAVLVLSIAVTASAQERPAVSGMDAVAARWQGAEVVDVRTMFNARGDGRVATGCRVVAGSPTLICPGAGFSAADAGKELVVYDAGLPIAGFVQPLTTRIAAIISPDTARMANAARTTASSSRTLWGSDDTRRIQAAIDFLARRVDSGAASRGIVHIPRGLYLVSGISLPCGARGQYREGACDASYSNLWLRGEGRALTILENWNVNVSARGLLELGVFAEDPQGTGIVSRLRQVAVTDLALHQVRHPTSPRYVVLSVATEDVWVLRTAGAGFSHECYIMGGASRRWQVHENVMGPCGNGGPGRRLSGSALNLQGPGWAATRNHVSASGQAAEISEAGLLADNRFVGTGVSASPLIGVNIGSTNAGGGDNLVVRNDIVDFHAGVEITNVLGKMSGNTIEDNTFVNASVNISSGLERNTVDNDTVPPHRRTVVRGNRFRFTARPSLMAIQIAAHESVDVLDNTVTFAATFLPAAAGQRGEPCPAGSEQERRVCRVPVGFLSVAGPPGGARWRPRQHYELDQHAAPNTGNGSFYVVVRAGVSAAEAPSFPTEPGAVVRDGGVVWQHHGPLPRIRVERNRILAPPGALGSAADIALRDGTDRTTVSISALRSSYPLRIEYTPNGGEEWIPAERVVQ